MWISSSENQQLKLLKKRILGYIFFSLYLYRYFFLVSIKSVNFLFLWSSQQYIFKQVFITLSLKIFGLRTLLHGSLIVEDFKALWFRWVIFIEIYHIRN